MRQRKKKSFFARLYIQAHRIWGVQRFIDALVAALALFVLTFFFEGFVNVAYITLGCITFLLTPLIFKAAGVYSSNNAEEAARRFPQIVLGWGIVSTVLLFIGFFTQTTDHFSRVLLSAWLLSTPVFIATIHRFVRYLLSKLQASGQSTRKAVIGGSSKLSKLLADQLRRSPEFGVQLAGFFVDQTATATEGYALKPALGEIHQLPEYVRKYNIDIVYLALSLQQEERLAQVITDLKDTTASVYFVPNVTMFTLMKSKTYELNGIPLIAVWEVPFSELQYFVKRVRRYCHCNHRSIPCSVP